MESIPQTFKNLKFKTKLFLSYLVVILIPIMVLGIYSYTQSKEFVQKQMMQALSDTVKKMSDNINYKIERHNNVVDFIVFNTRMQQIFNNNYTDKFALMDDLRDYLEPFISNLLYINKEINDLTIYSDTGMNEFGNIIKVSDRISDTYWYRDTVKNYTTNWFYSDRELFAARNFIDIYSNKRLGVLYVKLDYEKIFDRYFSMDTNEYGLVILDRDDNVVFNREVFKNVNLRIPVNKLAMSQQGIREYNGTSFMMTKSSIPLPGWDIYCYIPVRIIAEDTRKIIKATIIISIICILTLLMIIWVFSNTMVKRIYSLNKKMEIVEKGNLDLEVSSRSRDEIGELTNRFGKMVKNLNALIQDVYQSKIIQKEAELKALQAQINPHFLYNSLSIINWKAIELDAQDISHVATRLSKFYRTTLNKGSNIISVGDELENTRSYMDIQLMMHDNNFDIIYNIEEEVYNYYMLNLILQPIAENALEHGVDCIKDRRGVLKIEGKLCGDTLEFIVEDNGPGMDVEVIEDIMVKQTRGYGLKNVNERIKIFFGNEYGVRIHSEIGRGTCISVVIPKYTIK